MTELWSRTYSYYQRRAIGRLTYTQKVALSALDTSNSTMFKTLAVQAT